MAHILVRAPEMLSTMSRVLFRSPREVTSMLGFQQGISLPRHYLPSTLSLNRCQSTDSGSQGRNEKSSFVHKVDDTQKMFIYGHRAGMRFTLMWYTLNSRKPLSPDLVREAMMHVHRKCPNYQVVVKENQGEMWWAQQDDIKIDMKVHEKGKPKFEAINELFDQGFDDANGPFVTYLFIPAEENDKCRLPEIKKEYPYQYYFAENVHHGIADGMTDTFISQYKLNAINSFIEGEKIDASEPFGIFLPDDEYQKGASMFEERLLKNPQHLEAVKAEVIRSNKLPTLYKAFPPPQVDNPTSKFVAAHLDNKILQRFADNCKKNGVSYGTGFQTASNTAVIELVQEAGVTDDSYDMSVNLAINLRRYMKQRKLPIFGLHTSTMSSVVTMDKNIRDNFWNNCKNLHQVNSDLIKKGSAVEQNVVRQLCFPKISAEEFYKTQPTLIRDYGFSNLGNIDQLVPGTGKHVQFTDIENYTSVHGFIYPYLQQIYAFRGNLDYSMSYGTNCMTDEVANKLINRVVSILTDYGKE